MVDAMTMRAIYGVIVAIAGIIILRKTGASQYISEAFEDKGEDFRNWKYNKIALIAVGIVLAVILAYSILDIISCVQNPMCYGWPIRAPPDNITLTVVNRGTVDLGEALGAIK